MNLTTKDKVKSHQNETMNTTTKDKVRNLLYSMENLRDSDKMLIMVYWMEETNKSPVELEKMSALQFLYEFGMGRYTNPESIRRMRQKIQEQDESLRGKSYHKRQKLEQDVRSKIRSL
jgi:hypothetical protein